MNDIVEHFDSLAELWHRTRTKDGKPQCRWDGSPYIEHPRAVARIAIERYERYLALKSNSNKIISPDLMMPWFAPLLKVVAKNHDILEDTNVTPAEIEAELNLFKKEYPVERVLPALQLLNKHNYANYAVFVVGVLDSKNFLAIFPKIADITHNLSDVKEGSMADKYRLSLYILNKIYE